MNNEKPHFLRRSLAYLIDLIIVAILSGILTTIIIKNDTYKNETQKLLELTTRYSSGEVTKEEFTKEYDDINYYLTKDSVGATIINCSVAIVYYVVLCYYCGGITLGKAIMKLKIVSSNDKKLNLGHYLIRGLLVNLILSNIMNILLVSVLNKDTFIQVYPKVSSLLSIFLLVTLAFIMYRNDGRGLHDLASNTMVISTKKKKESNEEVKEANVIEEKKTGNNKKENGDK